MWESMSACSDEISKIVIMCSGMTGCSSNQQKKKKKKVSLIKSITTKKKTAFEISEDLQRSI